MQPRRVLVVGAGPVGLSTALFLTELGVAVTVLEAEARLPDDMRASTFHPPTLDMLGVAGIAETLIAQGHRVRRWQYFRTDTRDAAVFDLGILADVTAHPYRLQCEQFRLTRAIAAQRSGHPRFELVLGATVSGFRETEDGVIAEAAVDGAARTFSGAYLVGADGAKSTVRRQLGFDLKGESYPATSITITVDFPFERYLAEMLDVNYVWTAEGHYSLMRLAGRWRVGFSPGRGQSLEDALSDANIQRHLERILPGHGPYPIAHRGAYTVHRRIADAFRAGRVLLAGDAAHLNSPSGGLGMNSGIHDARALADSLARVCAGEADDALDAYARVRRTIAVEDVQSQSDASYRRHRETDPARREQIWAELKATSADPAAMREFLLRSSMIAQVRRAGELA
jgi:2-polyprenyl-6-methoxyphenol hydroxylase-like FAD-dependent oxidoreductase